MLILFLPTENPGDSGSANGCVERCGMDADRSPLLLTNLLSDLETLCGLLVERVAIGDVLNSYLLAAGAQQIVEDYLHRDPLSLSRGAATLERLEPGRRGHIAAAIPRIARRLIWRASVARAGDPSAAHLRLDPGST